MCTSNLLDYTPPELTGLQGSPKSQSHILFCIDQFGAV